MAFWLGRSGMLDRVRADRWPGAGLSLKRLEDMPIGQRVVVTFVIVFIALMLLALWGLLSGGWDISMEEGYRVASADEGIQASKYDELIFKLDREAAGNAYRDQIERLFAVWMKDETGQPARAAVGASHA